MFVVTCLNRRHLFNCKLHRFQNTFSELLINLCMCAFFVECLWMLWFWINKSIRHISNNSKNNNQMSYIYFLKNFERQWILQMNGPPKVIRCRNFCNILGTVLNRATWISGPTCGRRLPLIIGLWRSDFSPARSCVRFIVMLCNSNN